MNKLLIATNNNGKVIELQDLLKDTGIRLLTPVDINLSLEVDEDGNTYAENSSKKALAFAQASGLISLADDSGLEVDALGGQPGVFSSRFGGPDATDRDKYLRIVELLEGVPDEKRTARFRAAVAIATPTGETVIVEGKCEGRIAREPSGEGGFGYDPIFFIPEVGQTMAEVPSDVKN
ncbi:MAG: RdgB/HAM1 family non-canonical purine NTP pyrophosphatase, partial [Anaerolineales bacterium]|nr:RdgB/HAM1 family non-canonical purine NTP pyrophosphatase [Anaerolineales bacterium]